LGFLRVRISAEKSGTCSIGACGAASTRIIPSASGRGACGPSLDLTASCEGPSHWRRRSQRPGKLRHAGARGGTLSRSRRPVTRVTKR
jgi:hypothetical protein